MIPAKMYPIIRGCFRSLIIPAVMTVITMIKLSSINVSMISLLLILGEIV